MPSLVATMSALARTTCTNSESLANSVGWWLSLVVEINPKVKAIVASRVELKVVLGDYII